MRVSGYRKEVWWGTHWWQANALDHVFSNLLLDQGNDIHFSGAAENFALDEVTSAALDGYCDFTSDKLCPIAAPTAVLGNVRVGVIGPAGEMTGNYYCKGSPAEDATPCT